MLLAEISGRRSGPLGYAHGWPCAYLHRDYSKDPKCAKEIYDAIRDTPYRISDDIFGPDSYQNLPENAWKKFGWPWRLEKCMSPWSTANMTAVEPWAAAVDFVFVVFAAIAVGCLHQWRRRRRQRLIQFRLRTVLAATTMAAIACAWAANWRDQRRSESRLVEQLRAPGADSQFYCGWVPPAWLPDCVLKFDGIGGKFERITQASLHGDQVTDDVVDRLGALTCVRSLSITSKHITAAGLATLKRLPRLTDLSFSNGSAVTESEMAEIAAIRGLAALTLADNVSADGLAQLRRLPRLRWLDLQSLGDSKALERINELQGLEQLSLGIASAEPVELRGLANLRQLIFTAADSSEWNRMLPEPTQTVRLESLPKLQTANLSGFGQLRLADIPSLHRLQLRNVSLDATALRQIRECAKLESLDLKFASVGHETSLDLHGLAALKRISALDSQFAIADLHDLSGLQSLEVRENDTLRALHLPGLPQLETLTLKLCPRLSSVDLSGARHLKSLTASVVPGAMSTPIMYELPDRPRRTHVAGLRQLTELENLDLGGLVVDAATVSDIATLTNLQILRLPATRLTDSDALRLSPLVRLTALELAGTEITDKSLRLVRSLPCLKQTWLNRTLVTPAAIKSLCQQFPGLRIRYDWNQNEVALMARLAKQARRGQRAAIDVGHGASGGYAGDENLLQLNGLDDLGWLGLSSTHVTDAGLSSLTGLDQLQSLDLSYTRISDAGLAALTKFGELRALNLAHTLVSGGGLKDLQGLEHLRALDLSDTDITDETLNQLRFVPHLERLSLASTQVTDAGLQRLLQLPELRVLNLKTTAISPTGLAQLRGLAHLQSLALSDVLAAGPALDELQHFSQLKALELVPSTPISDQDVERLARLKRLEVLRIDSQQITVGGLQGLAALKSLDELWLGGSCSMSDEQRAALHQLTRLTRLRLLESFSDSEVEELRGALRRVEVGNDWESASPVFAYPIRDDSEPSDEDFQPNGEPPPEVDSPNEGTPVVGAIISPSEAATLS
jgi:Leucine-rich repeat (LRR) protein